MKDEIIMYMILFLIGILMQIFLIFLILLIRKIYFKIREIKNLKIYFFISLSIFIVLYISTLNFSEKSFSRDHKNVVFYNDRIELKEGSKKYFRHEKDNSIEKNVYLGNHKMILKNIVSINKIFGSLYIEYYNDENKYMIVEVKKDGTVYFDNRYYAPFGFNGSYSLIMFKLKFTVGDKDER